MERKSDLVFADPHINENSIWELRDIFYEIADKAERIKPGRIICEGDWIDTKRVSSEVLFFSTEWALKFKRLCDEFIMLRGNHDSTAYGTSVCDYLQHLGIKVVNDIVIDNIFHGHAMCEKSAMAYGLVLPDLSKYERAVSDLEQYDFAILGHQHSPQEVTDKIVHLGSCRYISFNEVEDECKYIGIIDYENKSQLFTRIPLYSPYVMLDIKSLEEVKNVINPHISQVRFIVDNFEYFKEHIAQIQELKNHFYKFKVKLNFKQPEKNEDKKKTYLSLQELLNKWYDKIDKKTAFLSAVLEFLVSFINPQFD